MAHFFGLLVGTALLRPYVVAFFAVYLVGCSLQFGLKRTLLFAIAGYFIAWGSEFSSIHNGFPYGLYYYIESTAGRELWVKGVPLMDSASYVFLAYASYSTALLALCPLLRRRGHGFALLDTRRVRALPSARALAALLFVTLDIIIDPLALRGDRWFLGKIYGYPGGGIKTYFGVPISNFIGWAAVGYLMAWAFQALDIFLHRGPILRRTPTWDVYGRGLPWRFLIGPALYLSVLLFNLSITFYIGEYNIGWAGVFITLPIAWLLFLLVKFQMKNADDEAVRAHLLDFPGSLTGILAARNQAAH